jgi:hypothetical protein
MILQYSRGSSILRLFYFRQYNSMFHAVRSLNYTSEYLMQAETAEAASELFLHDLI